MRTLSRDSLLLTSVSVLLVCELLYLFHSLRVIQLPVDFLSLDSSGVSVAVLEEKTRTVRRRGASSLTWWMAGKGDSVYAEDTFFTGDDSYARFRFPDQSELLLEPQSLLRFSQPHESARNGGLRFDFTQGTFRLQTKNKALRVRVRGHELALTPGSKVTVDLALQAPTASVRVDEGKATLETEGDAGPAVVPIEKGEVLRTSQSTQVVTPQNIVTVLNWQPLSPAESLQSAEPEAEVSFQWEGDAADWVEVDTTAEFKNPSRYRVSTREAHARLLAGGYFWRARQGLLYTEPRKLQIACRPNYRGTKPTAASFVKASEAKLELTPFPWTKQYVFEIARDRDFSEALETRKVDAPEVVLKELKNGTWYWRVRAIHPALGEVDPSPVFDFKFKRPLEAPKVKGAKVLPGKQSSLPLVPSVLRRLSEWIIPSAHADTKLDPKKKTLWMEFTWESIRGAQRYRFEVSLSDDFKKLVAVRESSDTQAVIELPDAEKFYWRVAARDDAEDLGKFSKPQLVLRANALPAPPPMVAKNPSVRMPASKGEEPKVDLPKGPLLERAEIRVGYGAGYYTIQTTGTDFTSGASGVALHNYRLDVETHFRGKWSMWASLWFQPLAFRNQDATIGEFQRNLSQSSAGGFLLLQKESPWAVGLWVERDLSLVRQAAEALQVRYDVYGALAGGWRGRDGGWNADILGEVGPVGVRRGVGLWTRAGYSWRRLQGTPTLNVSLHPRYRLGPDAAARDWWVAAAVWFSIQADI